MKKEKQFAWLLKWFLNVKLNPYSIIFLFFLMKDKGNREHLLKINKINKLLIYLFTIEDLKLCY